MLKKREYPRLGETVYTGRTECGLPVTVIPRPGYRKSMAFLAVNYGGADRSFTLDGERYDTPAGTAHFLEHRMFQLPGGEDAMTTLSERGANANAFTSPDMTAYHFECTERFDENLALLLRFVSTPCFEREQVDRERAIIAREIRMTGDDPDDEVYYALLRCLYARSPIRDNVAGTPESIGEITPEILETCHRAFYTPGGLALVVMGPVEPERVFDLASRMDGPAVPPRVVRIPPPPEGETPESVRAERAMDVGAPLFLAGERTLAGLTGRESVRFELTADLAISSVMGESTPLYRRLFEAGLINETFGCEFENSAGFSHLSFGGETQNPDLVCLRVLEEAARTAARGIDPEFFARRKRTVYGGAVRALNSFESVCCNVAAGVFSGYDYFDTLDVLDSVTAEDARGFIAGYMTQERTAISIITPKKER